MIKHYIFDLGNVLARFDPHALTAACVSDEVLIDPICNVAFDRTYWDMLDHGDLTDNAFKRIIRHRLPAHLQDLGCEVFDHWAQNMTPIDGMAQLIEDIKKSGTNLYLISNISIGFSEIYHQIPWLYDILSRFDGLAFSGPLHMTKPAPEIFRYVLDTYDLKAEECVFIDDSIHNIKGAESVGIHGYLFDGDADALRRFLQIDEVI